MHGLAASVGDSIDDAHLRHGSTLELTLKIGTVKGIPTSVLITAVPPQPAMLLLTMKRTDGVVVVLDRDPNKLDAHAAFVASVAAHRTAESPAAAATPIAVQALPVDGARVTGEDLARRLDVDPSLVALESEGGVPNRMAALKMITKLLLASGAGVLEGA